NAGTYYIQVYPWTGLANNYSSSYYRLALTTTAVSAGDRYEPNDTMATATSIANNATITDANIHVSTDVDYYKFTLTSTSNVTVNLSNIPVNCDYDLKLYDSANVLKGSSAAAGNNPENITTTLNAGTYYIYVYPYKGSSSDYYRLALTSTAVSTYTITKTPPTNGSFTVPTSAAANSTVQISSILPTAGYSIGTINVRRNDTQAAVPVSGTGSLRTFTMPAAAVTVSVTFTRNSTLFDNKKIYKLRNINSGKYLNVSTGYNRDRQNVFQNTNDKNAKIEYQEMAQEFRIIYDSTKDAYRIYPICSYNGRYRVLDISKSGGAVANNCNVQIFTPTDDDAQLFKIVDTDSGRYRITANSNTTLALAAYGTSDGSDGGTSYNSAGNVFMQTYTGANNQLWNIEEFPDRREDYYSKLGVSYPFTASRLTDGYGYRYHPIRNAKSFHNGMDIGAAEGTALYAPFDGRVVKIGYESDKDKGRGNYIIIEATSRYVVGTDGKPTETKLRAVYMHMVESPTKTNSAIVETAFVSSSTQVGKVGSTGASTGNHLHLTFITDGSESGNSITTSNNPQMYYDDRVTFSYSP
ncbi:MAG: peptidoglycan DD-metalloendopeptidase family protein, partial [Clostridiales bacterium]|nr:peptidoglycan DD-metalloendopeptidase family protein [Clostridiales bacterium]